MWQSVRQGRNNFRSMWEMVFQSEELQNMCRCVEDTNHFETFEGRRRAGVAGAFLGTFWEPAERSWASLGRLLDSSWSQKWKPKSPSRAISDFVESFSQRLSMPKLVAECLEMALQVSRHLEIVFQSEGLQSPWQSVRQGRTNFRGMCEMVFQSEELQSMWQSVDDTNNFEAVAGGRRKERKC